MSDNIGMQYDRDLAMSFARDLSNSGNATISLMMRTMVAEIESLQSGLGRWQSNYNDLSERYKDLRYASGAFLGQQHRYFLADETPVMVQVIYEKGKLNVQAFHVDGGMHVVLPEIPSENAMEIS